MSDFLVFNSFWSQVNLFRDADLDLLSSSEADPVSTSGTLRLSSTSNRTEEKTRKNPDNVPVKLSSCPPILLSSCPPVAQRSGPVRSGPGPRSSVLAGRFSLLPHGNPHRTAGLAGVKLQPTTATYFLLQISN